MVANLQQTEPRPWPMPTGRWVMAQVWHDLLFAHWPMDAEKLRPHIPARLEIDRFGGRAWLGLVPFRMSGVRLRGMPALPWLSAFPELNVRTYVEADGKPGVWFFSLDARNALAVAIARAWFHLPYFHARMSCKERNGWVEYGSERKQDGAKSGELSMRYRGAGAEFFAQYGTIEYFLTERYCLYAADGQGRVARGEIHHAPWRLQNADAEWSKNTMAEAARLSLPAEKPLLYFSKRQDVVVWQPHRLEQ